LVHNSLVSQIRGAADRQSIVTIGQARKKRFLKKARKNFCELGELGPEVPLIGSVGAD
jgi:hypothetical protein